jgi:DNA-directed RNA polymerase
MLLLLLLLLLFAGVLNCSVVVRTLVQTVVLAGPNDDIPVHVARQQSAFPPNYVHSLDSTHMLLTAKACYEAGIT